MIDNKAEDWWKQSRQTKNREAYYSRLYPVVFDIRQPVLDIGGGNGSFLTYRGIFEADILDLAGSKSLLYGNYNFIEADLTKKLPELKKKYKTIFIMETLEHLKNPLYLLAQAKDYLADDGCIYISVPYTKLNAPEDNALNVHVCRWTDKELEDQCQKLGYKTEWVVRRRRFKGMAFWLPHCFLILKLTKDE